MIKSTLAEASVDGVKITIVSVDARPLVGYLLPIFGDDNLMADE